MSVSERVQGAGADSAPVPQVPQFDVVVIGGGPAGVTAALRARELGASVALVERGELGGTCTNDGCVPTRVLARAARLMRDAEQFATYGLVGEPPAVDFSQVLARTQQVVYRLHEKKQLIAHLQRAGATTHARVGAARFEDPHTILLGDGQRLHGDKFILCAGGRARRLDFPGGEHALTHSDVWSLQRLPSRLVIVGGAATGSQLASVFSDFGSQVWVLESGPRLLGREDELVSQTLMEAFQRQGIQVITGIGGVDRIEPSSDGLQFWYTRRDGREMLTVDAVILATGWPGNADGLDLEKAGVRHERGYVLVDDYLRSSVGHIFAAGDITGRMMLVQSAGYEARMAAENAVLGVGQRAPHPVVPHGGFTDPEYASVGLTEAQARAAEPECVSAVVTYADLDRAVIDGHPEGFLKLIVSQETHRVLGAHMVGEQALEVVQLVAAGMVAEMWVEQLAEMELAYPTYTAIVGLAARRVVGALGVMPLAPQWRSLSQVHLAEWERTWE